MTTPRSVTLGGARVVTPHGVIEDGVVRIDGGVITEVGPRSGASPDASAIDLGGAWLLPGFIDLHMHGGGGFDAAESPDSMRESLAFHRAHGTTGSLVSLVAAPADRLVEQLEWVAALTRDGAALGAHLEGPFLARSRCGAQNPMHLLDPDPQLFAKLSDAASGTLRMVTLAPELPGAVDLVREVVEGDAVAALGHSNATYDEAVRGIDAGASVATHLFNGVPPLHHREPGLVGAALAHGLACELINDGIHVHPAIARLVDHLVLVTDSIAAAGTGDGMYALGDQQIAVVDGVARLPNTGSLAGSTLTMAAAVRRTVRDSGLSIERASAAASARPAAVLGIDHRVGRIAVGLTADLVVLDAELYVAGVLMNGEWSTPLS